MNILFMGTPDYAACTLDKLIKAYGNDNNISVVTRTDKPKGRSLKLAFSAVKELALENGLNVCQPENLKKENFEAILNERKPDIIIVAAYGKILPEYVLRFPKYGCINVHASLLPLYRGAAPINRCIMDGKKESGITIMQMEKGIDTGDILLVEKTAIDHNDTAGTLYERLCEIGARLAVEAVKKIINGEISPIKQDESLATYAEKIETQTQIIDFSVSAEIICNLIRGLSPSPAALTKHEESGKIVKVFSARIGKNVPQSEEFGKIISLDKTIEVACKDGSILIDEIAMEGSKRMKACDFINGRRVMKGDKFI